MTNREHEGLRWTCNFEGKEQVHQGYLIIDQSTDDLFQAVANLLEDLNNGGIKPEFPSQLFHQDRSYLEALGIGEDCRFFALKDSGKVRLLLVPSVTVVEHIVSQIPKNAIVGISGSSPKTSFKIFNLEFDDSVDRIIGWISKQGDEWVVNSVFDKGGCGFNEYKERLRELGCPVINSTN